MMSSKKNIRGFSLVEIIVSVAIIISVITAATGAWRLYFKALHAGAAVTQAALITEEASEALNFLRDDSWSSNIAPITLDTTYYLHWNGGEPALSGTRVEFINGYAAEVAFTAVSRDTNSNIVSSGGSVDPRTRSVFITVTPMNEPGRILTQSETLLHDLFIN